MRLGAVLVIGVLASLISVEVVCGQEVIAGKITGISRKNGDVVVTHVGGSVSRPGRGAPVYSGDDINITGDSYACIATIEDPDGPCYSRQHVTVKAAEHVRHRPGVVQILAAYLSNPSQGLPQSGFNRGGPDDESAPLRAHPLLPQGVQYMPDGYAVLAPIWIGPEATVSWRADASDETETVSSRNWTLSKAGHGAATVSIGYKDRKPDLVWRIAINSNPPRPQGLNVAEHELTSVDRTDRAAWILASGPVEWHLFALSDLSELKTEGSFEAGILLDFATSEACTHPTEGADNCPFIIVSPTGR